MKETPILPYFFYTILQLIYETLCSMIFSIWKSVVTVTIDPFAHEMFYVTNILCIHFAYLATKVDFIFSIRILL